jgi:hypothetical protein
MRCVRHRGCIQAQWFVTRLANLREHHRRRPTLIAMLD